jgi:hypothetical protein
VTSIAVLCLQLRAVALAPFPILKRNRVPPQDGFAGRLSMSPYENRSTVITSNRPVDDWAKLLGDVVVVTPLLDRLMNHAHLLKFDGKSWRLKEAAARVAKRDECV